MLTEPLLYQRIYDDLADQITTGKIGFQERLPALPELCRLYGVSEASVRRALDELERANYIVRQRGRGKGTVAIRRIAELRLRVLLMDDLDSNRNSIELYHEVNDILAGVRAAAVEWNATVQFVSRNGYDSLPPAQKNTGYLVVAQGGSGYEEGMAMAAQHGVPCVLVNPPGLIGPCIRVDMESGAYQGTRHLITMGHRRIGYVGPMDGDWFAPRFAGYSRALQESGIEIDEALIVDTGGVLVEEDEAALDQLMALTDVPTAIFACSDYRALHLLNHCRRRGIAVPQDLSLCGYDNIDEIAGVEPALTSVHHPRYELGKEAVAQLSRLLSGDSTAATDHVLIPTLVGRDSCAPPAHKL